jgi:hypothetical protein
MLAEDVPHRSQPFPSLFSRARGTGCHLLVYELAIAQYSPFLDSQPYEIILWNSKDMELNKAKPQTLARNDNYGN